MIKLSLFLQLHPLMVFLQEICANIWNNYLFVNIYLECKKITKKNIEKNAGQNHIYKIIYKAHSRHNKKINFISKIYLSIEKIVFKSIDYIFINNVPEEIGTSNIKTFFFNFLILIANPISYEKVKVWF